MIITLASILMLLAVICFAMEAMSRTPMFATKLELVPLGLAFMAGSLLVTLFV